MKIGVDLDECLAEFVFGFLEYHNQKYKTSFTAPQVSSYNLHELLECDRHEAIRRVHDFYQTYFFEQLPPVFYSRETIRFLSTHHDLYVITSRPESIRPKTERWINYHFPYRFQDIICTNEWNLEGNQSTKTKGEVCCESGIRFMIEDNMDYSRECSENGIRVFLLDKPWNQGNVNGAITRIKHWYDLLNYFGEPHERIKT